MQRELLKATSAMNKRGFILVTSGRWKVDRQGEGGRSIVELPSI